MGTDTISMQIQQIGKTFTGITDLPVLPANSGIYAKFLKIQSFHIFIL